MDKKQQEQMIDFIINKNLELGKTLQDVIGISLKELSHGSTDSEASEFHTLVKEEAERRLRTETRKERFPEAVSKKQDEWDAAMEETYWKEQVPDPFATPEELAPPSLSDEELMKMLQNEYDRSAYLDPETDNINI
jgi:hypothetical protein